MKFTDVSTKLIDRHITNSSYPRYEIIHDRNARGNSFRAYHASELRYITHSPQAGFETFEETKQWCEHHATNGG